MLIQSRSREGKSIALEQKQRTESEKEIKQFHLIKGKKIDKISMVSGLRKKNFCGNKKKKRSTKKKVQLYLRKNPCQKMQFKDTVKN